MGKIKAATISERFGFKDEDLKTPKHDEIMVWLDGAVERYIGELPYYQEKWEKEYRKVTEEVEKIRGGGGKVEEVPGWQERQSVLLQKTWEYPIMDRSYVIGFVDMVVKAQLMIPIFEEGYSYRTGKEYRATQRYSEDTEEHFAFEVKSSIPSLGELIRQINHYRAYLKHHHFIVVSPDNHWEEMLKKQDIHFLHYPQGQGRVGLFDV